MSTPTVGPQSGKVWGTTQEVFALNGVSAHYIHIKRGGYCSKHLHRHKWNRFVVLRGDLAVRIYDSKYDMCDETIISPGGVTDVPPGVRHLFEALTDVDAIEFYWTELEDSDIDRCGTVGGVVGEE